MTISIDIGKSKATIKHNGMIGYRTREVDLDVQWHSCGVFQVTYYRPSDAKDHRILVTEDWYPPNVSVSFTPEHLEKVFELYPDAPKRKRMECYIPFYEDYDPDRGMFDMGNDMLFQAYKDPPREIEHGLSGEPLFPGRCANAQRQCVGADLGRLSEIERTDRRQEG